MNELEIRQLLETVVDPALNQTLKQAKMLESISVEGQNLTVNLILPTPAYPDRNNLEAAILDKLTSMQGDSSNVKFSYKWEVRGKQTGGAIGLKVKNVIAVGSGKGGVGKSTFAACLAYGLKHFGARVGLMDADIYGPSIPHMVGASGQPAVAQVEKSDGTTISRIQPVIAGGMPLMSIGFMIPEDQAVIWRGPMLHKLLTQFLKDTDWGELDYLIIDLPPGTGDVALTLSQLLGLAGAVIVCTPQKVALLDAIKAIGMFRKLEIPILGMVENMTGEIFGEGGAKSKAEELNLECLGQMPMLAQIRQYADEGRIEELFEAGNPAREPLLKIVEQIAMSIPRQLKAQSSMPTFEILS